ncbi:hypothetical protein [Nostoc sp.]
MVNATSLVSALKAAASSGLAIATALSCHSWIIAIGIKTLGAGTISRKA